MLSVHSKKAQVTEVWVNCTRCHDSFTLGVGLSGRRILSYDTHPHVVEHNHSRAKTPFCHCGGELRFILRGERN